MVFDVTQKLAESYSKETNHDKVLEFYSQLIDVSDRIKHSGCERLLDMFVEIGILHLKGMRYRIYISLTCTNRRKESQE